MKEKLARRNFLGKLGLGLSSAVAIPFMSLANSVKEIFDKNTNAMNPIIKIKPLGFQWETADPFLFCVHHEDFFPKGNNAMGPVS